MAVDIYVRRRAINVVAMLLSGLAAAAGLLFLVWILWITVKNGISALDLKLFTKITAYADQGGLANAIVGSLVMDMIALALCAPVGVLAGTFLAEFANRTKLGAVIRFLNDILLSAPSIVLGLFVYVIVVLPMSNLTHGSVSFSGLAGAIALALIGLPVIVRTTDEMLQLVPGTLREAALSLGVPQWKLTVQVLMRAAL
ncbi:MAG: ABC transporter permease subunit, partial [Xanthomonadaceae bacterium]|nr:ABC transporter permease subunit [Xanthomonadaceae bacterium]